MIAPKLDPVVLITVSMEIDQTYVQNLVKIEIYTPIYNLMFKGEHINALQGVQRNLAF